jgi:hypothetical protein
MAAVKARSFFGGDLLPSIYALFASVDASVEVSVPSLHHCHHSQTTHRLLSPMDVGNTPTRVEELWFSDGGLVVQAEQSLYRVSGAILAARSPVFKDMLSFTQPPDAETIDGCPVVRLPDSAADVTCFFKAIFDFS